MCRSWQIFLFARSSFLQLQHTLVSITFSKRKKSVHATEENSLSNKSDKKADLCFGVSKLCICFLPVTLFTFWALLAHLGIRKRNEKRNKRSIINISFFLLLHKHIEQFDWKNHSHLLFKSHCKSYVFVIFSPDLWLTSCEWNIHGRVTICNDYKVHHHFVHHD